MSFKERIARRNAEQRDFFEGILNVAIMAGGMLSVMLLIAIM